MARLSRKIKLVSTSLLVISSALLLIGCSSNAPPSRRGIKSEQPFHNYISMAPSNTEIIYGIGADNSLLGVCSQCDFPEEVKNKPKIGSFTNADPEKLAMLHPEAAFLVDGQESIAAVLKKQHIEPIILSNNTIEDISANTKRLGRLTHHSGAAMTLASTFDTKVGVVRYAGQQALTKPKVLLCVWPDPLVVAGGGSYMDEAITICGGINVAGKIKSAYPQFSAEKLVAEQPDILILPHEADSGKFLQAQPWASLNAVKNRHYYFLPAKEKDHLSRPTLRLVKGLYWLLSRIHPEVEIER